MMSPNEWCHRPQQLLKANNISKRTTAHHNKNNKNYDFEFKKVSGPVTEKALQVNHEIVTMETIKLNHLKFSENENRLCRSEELNSDHSAALLWDEAEQPELLLRWKITGNQDNIDVFMMWCPNVMWWTQNWWHHNSVTCQTH